MIPEKATKLLMELSIYNEVEEEEEMYRSKVVSGSYEGILLYLLGFK